MYKISKEFSFDASHQLLGLLPGHKCMRLHGHTYTVIVELRSQVLNSVGFVTDYNLLDPMKKYIDNYFDHRHLNDVMEQPTAENLAKFLYEMFKPAFPQLYSVTVKETPKTAATYWEGASNE